MTATATRVWDKVEDGWVYEELDHSISSIGRVVIDDGMHIIDSDTDYTPLSLESITAQTMRGYFDSP